MEIGELVVEIVTLEAEVLILILVEVMGIIAEVVDENELEVCVVVWWEV